MQTDNPSTEQKAYKTPALHLFGDITHFTATGKTNPGNDTFFGSVTTNNAGGKGKGKGPV